MVHHLIGHDHQIRRSERTVQDRPAAAVCWANIPALSPRVGNWLWPWQCWQQSSIPVAALPEGVTSLDRCATDWEHLNYGVEFAYCLRQVRLVGLALATSGSSLLVVHASPEHPKVVDPRGSQRGSRALILDRLLFRPDISTVGADRASVTRCRWSLLLAGGRCCCCQPLVLFPISEVSPAP